MKTASSVGHWKPSGSGADDGTRTRDLCFTKALLYQLSYIGARWAEESSQRFGSNVQSDLPVDRRTRTVSLRSCSRNSLPTDSSPANTKRPQHPTGCCGRLCCQVGRRRSPVRDRLRRSALAYRRCATTCPTARSSADRVERRLAERGRASRRAEPASVAAVERLAIRAFGDVLGRTAVHATEHVADRLCGSLLQVGAATSRAHRASARQFGFAPPDRPTAFAAGTADTRHRG